MAIQRCPWAEKSGIKRNCHDHIWSLPVHDDKELFEMLLLEGMQAGSRWSTTLNKMDSLCAIKGLSNTIGLSYNKAPQSAILRFKLSI